MNVDYIVNGSYTAYTNIDLTGVTSFNARVASATLGGNIQICLDSPTATPVATCAVANTGGWQTWTTARCNFNLSTPPSGFHTVYLVYTGGAGYLLNIENFSFNF